MDTIGNTLHENSLVIFPEAGSSDGLLEEPDEVGLPSEANLDPFKVLRMY